MRRRDWPKLTVAELLDEYMVDAQHRQLRAQDAIERATRKILPVLGAEVARTLDPRKLMDFQKSLRREFSAATVNYSLSILRASFRHAARMGMIQYAPEFPRKLRENPPRQGFLEHSDYVAILAELPEWARDPFTFAYASAWRRSEIFTLRWTEVDMPGRVIRLDPGRSKTESSRVLPIRGEIAGVIKRCAAARVVNLEWVFTREGRQIKALNYQKHFKLACQIAGRPNVIGLHDCRRTAIRNFVRAGVPERVAMAISGHRTRAVFERYNIVSEDELGGAIDKLDAYLEEKAKKEEE